MKNKILNQQAGYMAVVMFLQTKKNIYVLETISVNNERYHIVKTVDKNIIVLYKRDFFNSFGKIFAAEGETGVGETINIEDLKSAIQKEVKEIYFIYPNAHICKIGLDDFLAKSHKRITAGEGKATRSVSVKHLERVGEMYE